MRVALISNDITKLEELNQPELYVDFFINSIDFGEADIDKYDVIISDFDLGNNMRGETLINTICAKFNKECILISPTNEKLNGEYRNKNIKSIVRRDYHHIQDFLKYLKTKHEIKFTLSNLKKESEAMLSFVSR